jgi:hypothetical protein
MSLVESYLVSGHQQDLLVAAHRRRLERSAETRDRRPRRPWRQSSVA